MVENFVQNKENYYSIMKEILRHSKGGINKKELLLELDFCRSMNGTIAPALREPPEFKVAQARRYFEGSRRAEPDWFGKGTPAYKKCITPWLHDLKTQYQSLTDDHLLIIARAPDQYASTVMLINSFKTIQRATGVSKYSSQALDAFDGATNGDVSTLDSVFGKNEDITLFLKSKVGESGER